MNPIESIARIFAELRDYNEAIIQEDVYGEKTQVLSREVMETLKTIDSTNRYELKKCEDGFKIKKRG